MSTQADAIKHETTMLEHIRELQVRLAITFGVLAAAGVLAYFFYNPILDFLRMPLDKPLFYNTPAGSFSFIMRICLVAAVAVTVPLIVYNLIMFARPAFPSVFTRIRVYILTFASVILSAAGIAFGYYVIIPGALHFFSGFQVHGLSAMISADSYLNFVINALLTFVLVFQLPILVLLADRIKPISPGSMLKGEKWALVGSLVIALLVPFAFDLWTQLMIAAPIFVLYNLAFVLVCIQHAFVNRKPRTAKQALQAKKEQEWWSRSVTDEEELEAARILQLATASTQALEPLEEITIPEFVEVAELNPEQELATALELSLPLEVTAAELEPEEIAIPAEAIVADPILTEFDLIDQAIGEYQFDAELQGIAADTFEEVQETIAVVEADITPNIDYEEAEVRHRVIEEVEPASRPVFNRSMKPRLISDFLG